MKIKFRTLAAAALVAIAVFIIVTSFSTRGVRKPPVEMPRELEVFIDGWNAAARRENLPAKFELSGDRAADAAAVLASLREWTRPFAIKPAPDYERELKKLGDAGPPTTFHAYEDFRRSLYRDAEIKIPERVSDGELAKIVNAYAGGLRDGRAPDYVTGKTVVNVAQMNSLRVFWEREGKGLRKKGVDTAIVNFSGLNTGGAYPWLDYLTKN